MIYFERIPNPHLNRFIQKIWYMKGVPGSGYKQIIFPDGLVEWIIHLDAPFHSQLKEKKRPQPKSFMLLQEKQPISIVPHDTFELFGIRFLPWGGSYFLPVSLKDLADKNTEAELIFGSSFQDFYSELYLCNSITDRMSLIEHYLQYLFDRNAPDRSEHTE